MSTNELRLVLKAKDEASKVVSGVGNSFGALKIAAAAALVAIIAGLVRFSGQLDDAYDKIRVGTGATGKVLEKLKSDFRSVVQSVPTDMASASTAITTLNQRLGLAGKPLQALSKQFLELSRITGTDVAENIRLGTRLFGDWSISAGNQVKTLDELFRATQQTGIGLGDLMSTVVQFGAPLRNMGFSFDESIAMLGKWEKEGVNITTVLAGMRFALKTFSKEGIDPAKGLAKAIDEIASASSRAAAMKIGSTIFGLKGASDVVAAIREGRFQYDEYVKSIRGGSDTVRKAARDTADWQEQLTLLKNRALIALEPTLMTFMGQLAQFIGFIERLLPALQRISPAILPATAALGGFLIISKIISVGTPLVRLLGRLATAMRTFGAAIPAAAPAETYFGMQVLGEGVTGVGAAATGAASAFGLFGGIAAAALVSVGYQVAKVKQFNAEVALLKAQTNIDVTKNLPKVQGPGPGAAGAYTVELNVRLNAAQAAAKLKETIAKLGYGNVVATLQAKLQVSGYDAFQRTYRTIQDFKLLAAKGINLVVGFTKRGADLSAYLRDLSAQTGLSLPRITNLYQKFGGDVSSILGTKLPADVKASKAKMDAALIQGITGPVGEAVKHISKSSQDVGKIPWKTKKPDLPDMRSAGAKLVGDLAGSISKGQGKVKTASAGVARAANPKLPNLYSGGLQIGAGLAAGILDSIYGVQVAGLQLASAAATAMHQGLQIHSPSQVTYKMGMQFAQGFAIGIGKGTTEAVGKASQLASDVLSVMDSALGIGADVSSMQSGGLPTAKIAKQYASRVAKMVKAMYAAMRAELGKLNLLDSETKKGASVPGAGSKFSAVATMVGDIGGIFSAFADLTTEKVSASLAAITAARGKSRQLGAAVAGLAKDVIGATKGLLVSEFTGGNASRIMEAASGLAGIIGTFASVAGDQVEKALTGISAVAEHAKDIAGVVAFLARTVGEAFTGSAVTEAVAAAASTGMQLASDLAGIITTVAGVTQQTIDDALAGSRALYESLFGTDLVGYLTAIVWYMQQAFQNSVVDDAVGAASSASASLISDLTGVITGVAAMTEATIKDGIAGAGRVVAAVPAFGGAVRSIVGALAAELAGVVVSPELAAASSASAALVSEITGVITSLGSMTEKAIQDGIWGAGWVSLKAVELGDALRKMLGWLSYALQGVGADSLGGLQASLTGLSDIAAKIAAIVSDLAGLTASQLTAATTAGASLGQGFLNGLLSQHAQIVAEANAIAFDTARALAGDGSYVAQPAYAMAGGGGGGSTVQHVTVQFSGPIQAGTPAQAQQAGEAVASAIITKLASAKRATGRSTP